MIPIKLEPLHFTGEITQKETITSHCQCTKIEAFTYFNHSMTQDGSQNYSYSWLAIITINLNLSAKWGNGRLTGFFSLISNVNQRVYLELLKISTFVQVDNSFEN